MRKEHHAKPAKLRKQEQRARDAEEREQVTAAPVYNALCEALIRSTRLTAAEALDPAKVAAEATKILDWWPSQWPEE